MSESREASKTEPTNNIEEYRKRRKKKKLIKRLIAVLVILVLLAAIVIIGVFSANRGEDTTNSDDTAGSVSGETGIEANGFPISLGGTTPVDMINCGKNLFLLTKNSLIAFNDAGKETHSVNHGYSNPVVKASSKRVLTYDQGGYQFRVDSGRGAIGSKKLTEKITCGAVSDNGYVAIATQTERYSIKLTVYDTAMKEILSWNASDKIILDMDFNKNSSVCTIAAFSTEAGKAGTRVIGLSLKKKNPELFETSLADEIGISVDYKSNGNIGVVTDRKSYILDSDGKIKGELEYSGALLHYANDAQESIAVCTEKSANTGVSTVAVLTEEGTVKNGPRTEERVLDLSADKDRLLVLTVRDLSIYNDEMTLVKTQESGINALRTACFGSRGYLLEMSRLTQFALS